MNLLSYPIGTMTAGEARAELLDLKGQVEAINALFNTQTARIPAADWSKAQGLLSVLKDRVDRSYQAGSTLTAKKAMNRVEEAVFYHAMADIHSHLRIRRGSRPYHTWLDALADVHFDLDYWLRRLDNPGLIW